MGFSQSLPLSEDARDAIGSGGGTATASGPIDCKAPWIGGYNSFTNELKTPKALDEIKTIVKDAYSKNKKVRVIGSCHSSPPTIILGIDKPDDVVLVSLTKYRDKTLKVAADGTVTVKAGTNLGRDPNNPDSTLENSFTKMVDDQGWALPITGGIIHQALGGFTQTGSAGGSFTYSVDDAIVALKVITGTGDEKTFNRGEDGFYAGGISMGLFGIVTDITLKLEKSYYVDGAQTGYDATVGGQYPPPVDIFGKSSTLPDLPTFLSDAKNVYNRLFWYPQKDLNRLQVWRGTRTPKTTPVPYQEVPTLMQPAAKGVLAFAWQAILAGATDFDPLIAAFLNPFAPLGEAKFVDVWYKALPAENAISDLILPTCFTELWIDIKDTTKAMEAITDLFKNDKTAVGNLPLEMYSGKKSDFWLSPAYTGNKIRLDVLFHQYNTKAGNLEPPFDYYPPEQFFKKYWDALDAKGVSYNAHWGKYRPDKQYTAAELKQHYPKYDEWLKLREQYDPRQIFVSPHWAKQLAIPPPASHK